MTVQTSRSSARSIRMKRRYDAAQVRVEPEKIERGINEIRQEAQTEKNNVKIAFACAISLAKHQPERFPLSRGDLIERVASDSELDTKFAAIAVRQMLAAGHLRTDPRTGRIVLPR